MKSWVGSVRRKSAAPLMIDAIADDVAPSQPWASLRYPGYRLIFFLSLFATSAQQMRQTQNLYQVYELSGSAFQLGLTGLAQGVPIFALGLFAGTLADFLDRKKLLLLTIFGNALVAIVQGVLDPHGRHRGLAHPRRHGAHFLAQHRAQPGTHGVDLPSRAAFTFNQRRIAQFERVAEFVFLRAHGRGPDLGRAH